jgi:hypothetical protein
MCNLYGQTKAHPAIAALFRRATLAPVLLTAIFCIGFGMQRAAAQGAQSGATSASQGSGTIRTIVVFRAKESDCPSGYAIFRGGAREKFPTDPQICYVRAPHAAGK